MKRSWIVLLSLGLVAVFSTSAFPLAADFFGEWYYRGWYIDNPSLMEDGQPLTSLQGTPATEKAIYPYGGPKELAGNGPAAHVDQRIRLGFRFTVTKGLSGVIRTDLLEDKWRAWGESAESPGAGSTTVTERQPDWAFDHAYINFASAIGNFRVGYATAQRGFGTDFMNSGGARPGIAWSLDLGQFRVGATWQKEKDNTEFEQAWAFPQSDKDGNIYTVRGNFDNKKGLDVGAQLVFARDASRRLSPADPTYSASSDYLVKAYSFEPYVRTKFGPVSLEAEAMWAFGKARIYDVETATRKNRDAEAKGFFVNGKVDLGPAYVGAWVMHQSGDDPSTIDKQEGNMASTFGGGTSQIGDMMFFSGSSWYIKQVFPYQTATGQWTGSSPGSNTFDNCWSYSLYGGFAVTPKLDLKGAFYYLKIDEYPTTNANWSDKELGKELYLGVAYKLYDNLVLSLDGVYLWTGDYFKGTNKNAKVDNNYYLMTMLDLTF